MFLNEQEYTRVNDNQCTMGVTTQFSPLSFKSTAKQNPPHYRFLYIRSFINFIIVSQRFYIGDILDNYLNI